MIRYLLLALLLAGTAHAQPQPAPASDETPHFRRGGMRMDGAPARHLERPSTETGQSAFAAIKDVVATLEADDHTDWSKVDIDALRRHLIDMDEVTLHAAVAKQTVPNGLRMSVTGQGRTLEAIRRMVPDQAREIGGINGMAIRTRPLPNGVELTVTSMDPVGVKRIQGLGFMGLMVQGSHHQVHHLAIAKGEAVHHH